MSCDQVVKAAIGAPLGVGAVRRRPMGRIAAGIHSETGSAAPMRAVDCDGCWLGEQPVTAPEDWQRVIAAGRLAEVEGAFALAWSSADGALNLARDGIGERTLFYAPVPGGLAYAASIPALLAQPGVARRLNLPAVATYLTYAYLPGRQKLIEGVFEVLPGERVSYQAGRLERAHFWQLPAAPPSPASEEELARLLRGRLETAVRRRLPPAGEAVGCTLSGGLDSSLVVALAAALHDGPVATFSVSFGPGHANELAFSALVSRHCRTEHTVLELSPAAVAHYLDDTVALLSDPIGDPLTVPNALLFRAASERAGVVLNGEGGDPCFGGPKNLPMLLAELYAGLSGGVTREASYLRAHLKCYDDLADMLSPRMRGALAAAPLEARLAEMLADACTPDYVAQLQALNIRIKGAHHILPKVDALSAPFGVLPRAPLFDRAVVELSCAIPARLKLKGSIEKYILKQAVRELLPEAIIARPKSGMLVPVESWCRGVLLANARERLLNGLQPYDLFRRDWLERLLAGRLGGLRPRHGVKIWLLMTLEAWLRRMGVAP